MGDRGPKSPAVDAVPMSATGATRPDPPDDLSEGEKTRWREIVGELPIDRFRESDLGMIKDLIISEGYVRDCDENIRRHGQIIGPGVQVNPAVALREKHLRMIVGLQRALRLCPSMRVRQDSTKLLGGTARAAPKKPWE